MSLTTSEMTPADIRACTCNDRDGGWGADGGAWWIIILFLFAFNGNGFGGWSNGNGALTRTDLCQDMNFSQLENAVRGVQQGICDSTYALNNSILNGFHGVDNAVCTLGYQTQQGFNNTNLAIMQGQNAIQSQLANCCCENREAIAQVRYDLAAQSCDTRNTIQNTTRDIIDNQNANTRSILDFLVNDKISTLQTENQNLKLAASQAAQNSYLVNQLRPCPTPAYVTCNPWAAQTPYGSCACNNGCCG